MKPTHFINVLTYMMVILWFPLQAQDKREVEIIHADFLKYHEVGARKLTMLVGDVQLRQEDMYMRCDSAVLYRESNSVEAYGNVRIKQDTIMAYGSTLRYDGNTRLGILSGNVLLTDREMRLHTREMYYDVNSKMAYYLSGGKVYRDSSIIVSRKGYYYSNLREVFFKDDVNITDPNYRLQSDTLRYNIDSKVSTFYGNTLIYNKDSRIACRNGWYDSRRDVSAFGRGTSVHSPPQTLFTDSLYYDRANGFGRAYHRFRWVDSSMDVELFGRYGEYYDKRQYIMATRKPLLLYKMDDDTLLLTADTLKSQTVSDTDSTRMFYAFRNVRMYTRDMQGICDSVFYSFADSTFRMFYQPVIWNEETQLSGDTVFLRTKDKKPDKLSIHNAGLIITPSGRKYFDQIKGVNIYGYFTNNQLIKAEIRGSAESIYFGKDEHNKYLGCNRAQSNDIDMLFTDKKLSRIVFIRKPEAIFTPIRQLTPEMMKLKEFKWVPEMRPSSRQEFFSLLE
ncbi:MAG: hypothetical protein NZM35_03785 [Chitinophagales bacterium]|nr:hypothetical protein [Chitinophagales bacterium]MDW8418150.1 OstA-like protein [Chitinophagales bacterium]